MVTLEHLICEAIQWQQSVGLASSAAWLGEMSAHATPALLQRTAPDATEWSTASEGGGGGGGIGAPVASIALGLSSALLARGHFARAAATIFPCTTGAAFLLAPTTATSAGTVHSATREPAADAIALPAAAVGLCERGHVAEAFAGLYAHHLEGERLKAVAGTSVVATALGHAHTESFTADLGAGGGGGALLGSGGAGGPRGAGPLFQSGASGPPVDAAAPPGVPVWLRQNPFAAILDETLTATVTAARAVLAAATAAHASRAADPSIARHDSHRQLRQQQLQREYSMAPHHHNNSYSYSGLGAGVLSAGGPTSATAATAAIPDEDEPPHVAGEANEESVELDGAPVAGHASGPAAERSGSLPPLSGSTTQHPTHYPTAAGTGAARAASTVREGSAPSVLSPRPARHDTRFAADGAPAVPAIRPLMAAVACLEWLHGVVHRELGRREAALAAFGRAAATCPLLWAAWADAATVTSSESEIVETLMNVFSTPVEEAPAAPLHAVDANAATTAAACSESGDAGVSDGTASGSPQTGSAPRADATGAASGVSSSYAPRPGVATLFEWLGKAYAGAAHLSLQMLPPSIEHLRALQRDFPRAAWLEVQLGSAYYHMKATQQSRAAFERALVVDPMRVEGMTEFSNLLHFTGDKVRLAALAESLHATHPLNAETWCASGNLFSLLKQPSHAMRHFHRAAELDPRGTTAWTLLGHEYLLMKQSNAAVEAYSTAVRVDARDYRAWYGLGQVYELLQLHSHALEFYRRVAVLRPSDSRMWAAVAACLRSLGGRAEEARACTERVVQCADADTEEYRKALRQLADDYAAAAAAAAQNIAPQMYLGQLAARASHMYTLLLDAPLRRADDEIVALRFLACAHAAAALSSLGVAGVAQSQQLPQGHQRPHQYFGNRQQQPGGDGAAAPPPSAPSFWGAEPGSAALRGSGLSAGTAYGAGTGSAPPAAPTSAPGGTGAGRRFVGGRVQPRAAPEERRQAARRAGDEAAHYIAELRSRLYPDAAGAGGTDGASWGSELPPGCEDLVAMMRLLNEAC